MTTDIRQALADLAVDADYYPQPAQAVEVARRRLRRRRASIPTVVVLALAIGLVAVVRPGGPVRHQDAAPALLGAADLQLPATLSPPAHADLLPTDHGVGRASLVYNACWTCPAYLVMPGGRQYRLDLTWLTAFNTDRPLSGPGQWLPVSLSPDGRWLGMAHTNDFLVRDLAGTQTRSYPIWAILSWSTSGRYAVVEPVGGSVAVLDLATGKLSQTDIDGYDDLVTDSGQLLSVVDADPGMQIFAGPQPWPNPNTGSTAAPIAEVPVAAGPGLTIRPSYRLVGTDGSDQGESSYADWATGPGALVVASVFRSQTLVVTVAPDGSYVFSAAQYPVVGAELVDATSGQVVRRIDVPAGAGRPEPVGVGPDLVVPVQTGMDAPVRLVLAGPQPRVLTQLGVEADYVLPGMGTARQGPAFELR